MEKFDSPGFTRYTPLLVLMAAILVILVIPLKIIGYGYLPPDDALADAAKAVSGKPWPEILVLKSDYKIDNHIGWHGLLRQVYLTANCNQEAIMLLSVVGLFALVGWAGLPWVARPEAWLVSLILLIGVQTPMAGRLMLGRPLMITFLMVLTILFLWKRRGQVAPTPGTVALMTGCMTVSIFLHGVWYWWALVLAAFILARQIRWGIAFGVSWACATIIAAVLTGHPIVYLTEAWLQAWNVMARHVSQRSLVTELQPTGGNYFPLLILGAVLVLRKLARFECRPLALDPAFWLATMAWVLGHQAERIWDDWGLPALMVIVAWDLDLFLTPQLPAHSIKRLEVMAGLAITAFFVITADTDSRWTENLRATYLDAGDPALAGWLPAPGGIFYNADMHFFYQTFYHNPTAPWRYMVGYEPVLMPPDDFAIYEKIRLNDGHPAAYQPWAAKMRPGDRLIVNANTDPASYLPRLEFRRAVGTTWIGRLKDVH